MAFPSLRLLYLTDERRYYRATLKVVGHQWYWSYEYDARDIRFDSYIVEGPLRLLEVDNRVVLPAHLPIRALITAADVLHCWTLPVLGVKADAVPGRLNNIALFLDRCGVYYGQCSEICGSNHSFMPIRLERTV